MTTKAVRRGPGINIVDVAGQAIHLLVGDAQGEVCQAMIKIIRRFPGRFSVTAQTVLREIGGDMVWVRRRPVVSIMAAKTVNRCASIDTADMTAGAVDGLVSAIEGKPGEIMIKLRAIPGQIAGMANHTVGRETTCDMIGFPGSIEVTGMTAETILRSAREGLGMAALTIQRLYVPP